MALITLLLGVLVFPVMGQDACYGGDSCCDSGGCLAGEGDCDMDSHCAGDLICGKDNCYGDDFDRTDDCCVADPSPNPIVNVNGTDGMDITVTLSCYGLKRAHEAIIRAQLVHRCSTCSNTGESTDCDRGVLRDLLNCPKQDKFCIFNLFANRTSCTVTEDKPDTICNALDQLEKYVLYSRMTFCEATGFRGDCGWWTSIACFAAVIGGGAACTAAGVASFGAAFGGCVAAFLGAGSTCIPCICDVFDAECENWK